MKCQEAEKLILLQDSGGITEKMADSLAEHLHDCESCRGFQHALMVSWETFQTMEEPGGQVVQNVLRKARRNAPEKKAYRIFAHHPILAAAASLLIGLGIFFTMYNPEKVGMELVVTATELLEPSDQLLSVMYSGLSEDDLAFNFLMTYEGNGQG